MPYNEEAEPDVSVADAVTPEQLLSLVATGDQQAFGDLYDLVAPRILGLARRLLVDAAQSEEVAQEVLLEVWQTAPRFDPSLGSATAWIMTLTHRRAVDRIRASQAGRDRDLKIGIRDYVAESDDVADTVEASIEHERVRAAMSRLSEPQRQAVSLAYFGGYTQSELAELLSVPLGTVKTRLRDGMALLRNELREVS